ncbi:MAG: RNA ligase family protein, partial [Peptostreptococcaceae bacterium]
MKEIKKYTDIIRYGKSQTEGVIKEGDYITITEKIDGANASFRLDETNPLGVSCYSRNQLLTEESTLSGFYEWVKENIVPIKDKLNPNYIYYGEWLVKHKIVYKDECYKNFYMFSIWDTSLELNQYLSDDIVLAEAERLELITVPYRYRGEYISFEHLMSFVGQSNMTKEENTGEGIVVKNVSYFDRFNRQCFVKIVSEKFAEVQKQKLPKNPNVK